MARLPEKVPLDEVFAGITEPLLSGVVPFGLAESTVVDSPLVTACIDFVDHPHVVATGDGGFGSDELAAGDDARHHAHLHARRGHDHPDRSRARASVGVVPGGQLAGGLCAKPRATFATVIKDLCAILKERQPPPGASQAELATKRFWEGRELFLVVDDITSWCQHSKPAGRSWRPTSNRAKSLGLHIVATADIRQFGYQSQGGVVLGTHDGHAAAGPDHEWSPQPRRHRAGGVRRAAAAG